MNGGGGYTPEQVGNMTQDQILFRLCSVELQSKPVGSRVKKAEGGPVGATVDGDGFIAGVAKDGTPIKARFRGKSLARHLMEEEEQKNKKGFNKGKRKRKPLGQK